MHFSSHAHWYTSSHNTPPPPPPPPTHTHTHTLFKFNFNIFLEKNEFSNSSAYLSKSQLCRIFDCLLKLRKCVSRQFFWFIYLYVLHSHDIGCLPFMLFGAAKLVPLVYNNGYQSYTLYFQTLFISILNFPFEITFSISCHGLCSSQLHL